jgi:hypothetical protein
MQRVAVFQQHGSGEQKIRGIRVHGSALCIAEVVSIDEALPLIIDEPEEYLPDDIHADIVLDFMKHPDLSYGLAEICRKRDIPIVASGKKLRLDGVFCPPT